VGSNSHEFGDSKHNLRLIEWSLLKPIIHLLTIKTSNAYKSQIIFDLGVLYIVERLLNWNPYERIMNAQNNEIHNLTISKPPFESFKNLCHFNVTSHY
jgi:hypothetical protein